MQRATGDYRDGAEMEAASHPLSCRECGESLGEVWEYVTEQRKYRFSLTRGEYVGCSDPVDDTSKLDYVLCPHCFEPLPKPLVEGLFDWYDSFTTSP